MSRYNYIFGRPIWRVIPHMHRSTLVKFSSVQIMDFLAEMIFVYKVDVDVASADRQQHRLRFAERVIMYHLSASRWPTSCTHGTPQMTGCEIIPLHLFSPCHFYYISQLLVRPKQEQGVETGAPSETVNNQSKGRRAEPYNNKDHISRC